MAKCNSCEYDGAEITIFECPYCNEKIVRCLKCKKISVPYKCKKCGFEGP